MMLAERGPRATAGWPRATTSSPSARPVAERATWRPHSAMAHPEGLRVLHPNHGSRPAAANGTPEPRLPRTSPSSTSSMLIATCHPERSRRDQRRAYAARYERRSIMITANQTFAGTASSRIRPCRRCGPPRPASRGKLSSARHRAHSQRHPKRTTEKGHLSLSQIGPGVSSSLDPETTHGHAQNSAVDTSPTMSLTIHQRCRATDDGLPCPLEAAGFDQGTEGQHSLSAGDPPAHAGALHALCHQGLVGSLDHA